MATVLEQAPDALVADTASADSRLAAWIEANQRKSLLRFITCGSVDDGKSTLIGRLLFDSRQLLDDQLATLSRDSARAGRSGALDFASLVDGLAAEREQGITIDVAYRFFATERRKFVVADTPGHEQFTRNMVTGASSADLAVILVDVTRGILTQTRRHSRIARLLGIRHLVLAVNKMDLVGYDRVTFDRIVADYRRFADEVGIEAFDAIPVSGLNGDNVVDRSAAMDWYDGPALLEHLEAVETRAPNERAFQMAVQWVNRPDSRFRGYAGRIARGRVRTGDEVVVLPEGTPTRIARIVTADGDLAEGIAGQSVTLTFADEVDCSRGDVIALADSPPATCDRIDATLVWMAEAPLRLDRAYWLRVGTDTVSARVDEVKALVDVESVGERVGERPGASLALNDIGRVVIGLERPIPAVTYDQSRKLGGFILIDRLTRATVAAGTIDALDPPRAELPAIAEHPLDPARRDALDALARDLSPAQASWLSGYFAGLHAGLQQGVAAPVAPAPHAPAPTPQARTLTILYGTETGNSRALATSLAATFAARGVAVAVADMADYKVRQLKDEQDLLFIVSTYGEGDPPQPAIAFFDFLEGPRAPRLEGVRFAVLALGDSTYEHYCAAGKRIERRLAELGARALAPRVDCDIDYDEPAAAWSAEIVERLAETPAATGATHAAAAPAARHDTVHDKRNPFAATVLETIRIVGRHSTKDTRHLELDLSGSGLRYQPGDALGLAASNDPGVVAALLEATGLSGDSEVEVKGATSSLAAALADRFEITTASPRFIDQWAKLSGSSELAALAGADAAADRVGFLAANHVVDIVRRFPVAGIGASDLLAGLRPLQPRLYSIASSMAAVGDEAHLTVAPVRYDLHGTPRGGVASTAIADRLAMGDTVPVHVQENPHFRLPADDVPIVMIGPGTGVAPFRAFLQEREALGAPGRSWLFFGERNRRSDFLYQVEMLKWLEQGVLNRLDVAFSRDTAERAYVQQRMREQARELFGWLEEGAHVYVCGDEKAMARDVDAALTALVSEQGGLSPEQAHDYVARLVADRRYQRDVY
ncbi:assimilatory sulfite reductase (NADPH) flavoprotein subunit [Sphingomonas sp. ASV193]|uniref:assimilatory sulfite reductase (NADPH) flavoprotein subunit n=1 Tax=Sphingomonas sp. ASV193 TaxID=3144405 RepID=UPI0032E8C625